MKDALSVTDIKNLLGCSTEHARTLVTQELPHYNIATTGGRPTWRVKRSDFDKWLDARKESPDNERIKEFTRRYLA